MAKVFLSYDREDGGKARSIAEALEQAGHSVWWDRHIRGGAQFSKEIEEALEKAEAVVVLWSAQSVDSAWVRDEAAEGRDRGILIPVLIEQVKPPLGFRQFQTIDLSDCTAASPSARVELLLDAISEDRPARRATRPVPAGRSPLNSRSLAIVASLLAVMIAGAAWWIYSRPQFAPTVSVAAADNSPLSQSLARNLLVKLSVLQGRSDHPIRIIDASDETADLNFTVNGTREDGHVRASIALVSGPEGLILWSKDYEPQATQSALEAQIGTSTGRVLDCAGEEASGRSGRLGASGRRTYLNACAMLAESGWDKRAVLPLLRRVLEESPKFRPAWTKLLYAETDLISFLISAEEPFEAVREQLRKDVAAARKLDPNMAEATLAEIELGDRNSVTQALEIADKANAQEPDNPTVLGARSMFLQSTGRMRDAIVDARRAAELDPLYAPNRQAYILALAYGGQINRARRELREAKKLWPGTRAISDAEYSLELRFGNFEKALQDSEEQGPGVELYRAARRDPSDSNVTAFMEYVRNVPNRQRVLAFVLQALGEMNRVDEFFAVADETKAASVFGFDAYILFRPGVAPARRDLRFMSLAKGIGLVDYWRKSGKWPDYCSEPDLPYDCKAEAAKLS